MPAELGGRLAHTYVPADPIGPPLVVVHGARTDPSECLAGFRHLAHSYRRPLLVPVFSHPGHRGYQRLATAHRPLGAASLLDEALGLLSLRMGLPVTEIDLVGFSGGAQFAHRYAMLFPARVRGLVIGAAGWYSHLDGSRPFPEGAAASEASGGAAVDIDAFLGVPALVLIGERDVATDGQLRTSDRLDREQGEHRLARGLRWSQNVAREAEARGLASLVQFELMSHTGHSFRQAMEAGSFGQRALAFLSQRHLRGSQAHEHAEGESFLSTHLGPSGSLGTFRQPALPTAPRVAFLARRRG